MSYHVPNSEGYVPCPRCGNPNVKPVQFSWWGGAVGPRMIKLVRCTACKLQYKGKTGESPKRFIITYSIIVGVLSLIPLALYFMFIVS